MTTKEPLICRNYTPYLSQDKTECIARCSFLVSSTEEYTDHTTHIAYDKCKDGNIDLVYSGLAVAAIVLVILALIIMSIVSARVGACVVCILCED